jgi:cytochrome P450
MDTAATPNARTAKPGSLPLAPGPRYLTPFGFLRELRADSLGYLGRLQREYGDVVCTRLGHLRSYFVSRPEYVRHVLVGNHRNYEKGNLFAKLKTVAGEGLLFSEGEAWRQQRRWVAPAFQRSQVQGVVPVMGRVMQDCLERWQRERADGEAFDVVPEMSRLALDMVCRAMFGAEPPGAGFHRLVDEGLAYTNYLVNNFVTPPLWVPTRRNRAARRTLAGIHDTIRSMVESARTRSGDGADLLRLLMDARDEETGASMSEPQLLDQMITLLVAGHETTAMTLSWALYLLGQDPESTARLRSEADAVLGDGDPSAAELGRLEFTLNVVRESLRLYPPVWAMPRQSIEADEIGGYRIPRRTMVTMSPWIVHRHPEFWDEPERFDPDRFRPERSQDRPRQAFFPFGAGGRSCVGEDFALLEATLVLAMTLRRFDVQLVAEHPVEPDPILTLRPRHGIHLRLRERG